MTDTQAQAGWYGQPDGTERFWTGTQWSNQVRERPVAPMAPPPLPTSPGATTSSPAVTSPAGSPQLAVPSPYAPQVVQAPSPYGPPSVPAPGPYGQQVQHAPIGSLANPQLAYTQQGYVAVTQVAPKSPGLALLASFFVPGLGQLMNGQAGKGVLMFALYLFSFVLMFVLIGFLTAPAVWIWSMVDAYSGAQQWNARHGILS
jgi:TM2 domain-containing membrane protein YozV